MQAIKCSELLAVGDGPAKLSAAQLATAVPAEHWVGASAGQGAKGRRLYDWTRIQLAGPAAPGMARWLLARRSRRDGELAFYACYGPVDTSLLGLVRVAGSRWAIEDGFQQAKNDVGLDHYEDRKWPGWYRHRPGSAGPCLPSRHPHPGHWRPRKGGRGGLTSQLGLLPLTVPEVAASWWPWCGQHRSSRAGCWPGHAGADAIRPEHDAHTTSDANSKCGWSIKPVTAAFGDHRLPTGDCPRCAQPPATTKTAAAPELTPAGGWWQRCWPSSATAAASPPRRPAWTAVTGWAAAFHGPHWVVPG